jgi:hypothetical protein
MAGRSHNSAGKTVGDIIKGDQYDVDLVDSLLVPVFAVATLVTVGIGTFDLFGVQAASTFFSMGATDFTFAFVLGAGSLLVAAVTNMPETDKWTQWNWGIALSGIGLFVALEFMPELQSAVTGSDMMGVGVFVLEAAAFYTVAYL